MGWHDKVSIKNNFNTFIALGITRNNVSTQ